MQTYCNCKPGSSSASKSRDHSPDCQADSTRFGTETVVAIGPLKSSHFTVATREQRQPIDQDYRVYWARLETSPRSKSDWQRRAVFRPTCVRFSGLRFALEPRWSTTRSIQFRRTKWVLRSEGRDDSSLFDNGLKLEDDDLAIFLTHRDPVPSTPSQTTDR